MVTITQSRNRKEICGCLLQMLMQSKYITVSRREGKRHYDCEACMFIEGPLEALVLFVDCTVKLD